MSTSWNSYVVVGALVSPDEVWVPRSDGFLSCPERHVTSLEDGYCPKCGVKMATSVSYSFSPSFEFLAHRMMVSAEKLFNDWVEVYEVGKVGFYKIDCRRLDDGSLSLPQAILGIKVSSVNTWRDSTSKISVGDVCSTKVVVREILNTLGISEREISVYHVLSSG
jgi:rRNA maturation protein Nop10